VYSLNVPVPTRVAALASDIAREIPAARARARGEHTLNIKRLSNGSGPQYNRLETQAREVIAGQPPFEVRIDGIEYFPNAIIGTTPVLYLSVESPELVALHQRLAEVFAPIEGIEGDGYTPHVTISRGGPQEAVERLTEREIEPIEWVVDELIFWDATRSQPVSSVSLPA